MVKYVLVDMVKYLLLLSTTFISNNDKLRACLYGVRIHSNPGPSAGNLLTQEIAKEGNGLFNEQSGKGTYKITD